MPYGDSEARRHGIKEEGPAVRSLETLMKSFGHEVEHNSAQNKYDVDVKLKVNGKTIPVDVKTPSRPSENLAVSYYRKNFGESRKVEAFIDGNILAKKEFDKKCVGLAPNYKPKKMGTKEPGFFLVRKTMTIYEFIDYIEE